MKSAVKVCTYCVAIIYVAALACILVPVEVSFISGMAGIVVGAISGKVIWNHLIKKAFEGIDRGIVKVRNRICKNVIFCTVMKHWMYVRSEDIMKVLNYAPNVNVNIYESTPLIIAVKKGSIPVIEKLIELGADINALDLVGNRPLSIAVEINNIPVIERLIELGADINALDRCGRDSLLYVAYRSGNKNIMDILHSKEVDFVGLLNGMQDVITDEYFYGVVKQYMNKEVRDLNFIINKFERSEEGIREDIIETKINKFRVFLDTSKRVVKANNFGIRNLKDTSKFRDIWLEYNYNLEQIILKFYDRSKNRFMNELQNNGIQRVNTNNSELSLSLR